MSRVPKGFGCCRPSCGPLGGDCAGPESDSGVGVTPRPRCQEGTRVPVVLGCQNESEVQEARLQLVL